MPTATAASTATALRVVTLNVHGWHNESDESWDGLVALLLRSQADVVALQEATAHRIPKLAEALGGFYWTTSRNCAILSRLHLSQLPSRQPAGVGSRIRTKQSKAPKQSKTKDSRFKHIDG